MLFNLNDKEMFTLSSLIVYMGLMSESRNPLVAYQRVMQWSSGMTNNKNPMPYHKLRLAWNSFVRLLNKDHATAFTCNMCGDVPTTIICDATCIGFQKDLLDDARSKGYGSA